MRERERERQRDRETERQRDRDRVSLCVSVRGYRCGLFTSSSYPFGSGFATVQPCHHHPHPPTPRPHITPPPPTTHPTVPPTAHLLATVNLAVWFGSMAIVTVSRYNYNRNGLIPLSISDVVSRPTLTQYRCAFVMPCVRYWFKEKFIPEKIKVQWKFHGFSDKLAA